MTLLRWTGFTLSLLGSAALASSLVLPLTVVPVVVTTYKGGRFSPADQTLRGYLLTGAIPFTLDPIGVMYRTFASAFALPPVDAPYYLSAAVLNTPLWLLLAPGALGLTLVGLTLLTVRRDAAPMWRLALWLLGGLALLHMTVRLSWLDRTGYHSSSVWSPSYDAGYRALWLLVMAAELVLFGGLLMHIGNRRYAPTAGNA